MDDGNLFTPRIGQAAVLVQWSQAQKARLGRQKAQSQRNHLLSGYEANGSDA
jgi:hypothetical protein